MVGLHLANLKAHCISINALVPRGNQFRYIAEGEGATLQFHTTTHLVHDQEALHLVGTFGLITCVGVYFAINHHTCFVAHINAYTEREWLSPWVVRNQMEASWFRDMARDRMEKHALANGWDPQDPVTRAWILRTLILVCPEPTHHFREASVTMQQTVLWVVEGVRQFLNIPDVAVGLQSGFIMEHPRGKPRLAFEEGMGDGVVKAPAVFALAGFRPSREVCVENDWVLRRMPRWGEGTWAERGIMAEFIGAYRKGAHWWFCWVRNILLR
ncbi:hypothetical protein LTR56_002685 [Elasticomyces elasticus]|nr:hypothetical protein LTR22_014899 [Elasticomyces elasticus]KAK3657169.1 hypothetical protein LTR56_002685 [Elasticomyces elasticus]KAK4914358.1 hypothetical protein LTR49_017389 [Elasticomyces elasticus]KAK5753861.1 hypothetical protein LTS12_016064 [Elasticomyces elasticus]